MVSNHRDIVNTFEEMTRHLYSCNGNPKQKPSRMGNTETEVKPDNNKNEQ